MMAIDTLQVAKRLREAGFTEPQAEALTVAVQAGTESGDLATKTDTAELRTAIREAECALRRKSKRSRRIFSTASSD
jgi:predicted DNA-binding transcriptional regulator YafY